MPKVGAVSRFYNDNDLGACRWLECLMEGGHIAKGIVSDEDIWNLKPEQLRDYRQVHLFAGIGGWSHALDLAGWPRDREVWTGSCPCQPFSSAGKRGGTSDDRHLWPVMFRLIRACKPATVIGEQVSSADGYEWLAGVRDDLEGAGYEFGAADLPACCAGSPTIRQRLFWVASTKSERRKRVEPQCQSRKRQRAWVGCKGSVGGGVANPKSMQQSSRRDNGRCSGEVSRPFPESGNGRDKGANCGMGHANEQGRERRGLRGCGRTDERTAGKAGGPPASFWDDYEILQCRDGKQRRTQSGLFPLAHGVPGRVGLLRGAGNAIVPQVGAIFIRAYLESIEQRLREGNGKIE